MLQLHFKWSKAEKVGDTDLYHLNPGNESSPKSFRFKFTGNACSNTSYLIGGGRIAASICSQVGELLLELVVGAVAEAVDHGGGQQHADDAQDGHDGEDEELGRLRLAVLGGDLVDLASLGPQKNR